MSNKKPPLSEEAVLKPGSVLLSQSVSRLVPSALKGLTSEFGMGSGVAPSRLPPGNIYKSLLYYVIRTPFANAQEPCFFR